jgi:uncharacterized protein
MAIPLFLIPILIGLFAQALKPVFNQQWFAKIEPGGRAIPRYGGMPSAHTAFITSLATMIGLTDSFTSTTFALAAAMTILVLDDALRMRIFLGRYGAALRLLIKHVPKAEQARYPYLEERLGHKPLEVIVGAILGITLTIVTLYAIR